MKRKSKFIISALMSVILLLSIVLGVIIYQLKKKESSNPYPYVVSSESDSVLINSEFAKNIEIRFLKIDKKSKIAEIQVTFPNVKEVLNQEKKNTESTFKDMFGETGYTKLTLEVQVEKSENSWKIVSPEVIDEAVIKNINEGFDMIAKELGTIELGVE